LQELASQAEELAATEERNHLARELHDSVSQTIFSMTLTAKAARTLLERDLELVASQLDHLQELAQEALTEMRSLIFHLRPTTVDEEGLVEALRKHVAALESHQGLTVTLRVEGEKRLGRHQERRLFRIIQEALNNVSKHAQTDRAAVTLRIAGGRVWVQIEDQGRGFDPRAVGESGDHLGLVGMRERVERMGGVFTVESCPGEGTRIAVEVPEIQGDEPNGREEVA
jgi:signal transduction histidine kinase